jgi:hypothetical protein
MAAMSRSGGYRYEWARKSAKAMAFAKTIEAAAAALGKGVWL